MQIPGTCSLFRLLSLFSLFHFFLPFLLSSLLFYMMFYFTIFSSLDCIVRVTVCNVGVCQFEDGIATSQARAFVRTRNVKAHSSRALDYVLFP